MDYRSHTPAVRILSSPSRSRARLGPVTRLRPAWVQMVRPTVTLSLVSLSLFIPHNEQPLQVRGNLVMSKAVLEYESPSGSRLFDQTLKLVQAEKLVKGQCVPEGHIRNIHRLGSETPGQEVKPANQAGLTIGKPDPPERRIGLLPYPSFVNVKLSPLPFLLVRFLQGL